MTAEPVSPLSYLKQLPEWGPLTREEAIELIRKGVGSRPDLPPGTEFVRQARRMWRRPISRG